MHRRFGSTILLLLRSPSPSPSFGGGEGFFAFDAQHFVIDGDAPMPLHWFSPPVVIQADRPGVSFAVTNVERAGEALLAWKALGPGPKWKEAVQACMASLNGSGTADDAREAFEKAAQECGRLIV